MKFLGRKNELQLLEREFGRSSTLVVVYGRRRVGKTRLIKQFLRGKRSLYFLASQESEAMNLRRFAELVARFVGMPALAQASYDDWRPLFQLVADHEPDEPKVVVIDELPYLVEGNAALPSVLQYVCDETLSASNTMLVLCGSSARMMEDSVLSKSSPLYGRSSLQLRLRPLSFAEFQEGFGRLPFDDQLRIYTVAGGVPKYLEFFDGAEFVEAVERNVLSSSGFLYNEPRFLLAQDTRNPITHYSIMRAIAYGNHKPSEIASAIGRPQNEVSPYLRALVSLGYIRKEVPATEKHPDKSKSGLYVMNDNLLRFWFTYVLPFEGDLEMSNMAPSRRALRKSFESRLVATCFEEVSREALATACLEGAIPFEPNRVGRWWNRNGSVEVDVCATQSEGNALLLGECKCHATARFSQREYAALIEKSLSTAFANYDVSGLCLFSKTGFDPALIKSLKAKQNVYLFNENKLVRR